MINSNGGCGFPFPPSKSISICTQQKIQQQWVYIYSYLSPSIVNIGGLMQPYLASELNI